MPGTGWLTSERYTRSQTTYGLCGCLGTTQCGLGATLRRHPETDFLAHHLRPRTYHVAPGYRVSGYSKCRSHCRWLLYRTSIGGGDGKKSRGIRGFRSRVLNAGSPGCFWNGRQWTGARTGRMNRFGFGFAPALTSFCSLRWRPCVPYIIPQGIIALGRSAVQGLGLG